MEYVQVPEAHTVDPVYPIPPHCPHIGTPVGVADGLEVLVVLVAVLVVLLLLETTTPPPPLTLEMPVF